MTRPEITVFVARAQEVLSEIDRYVPLGDDAISKRDLEIARSGVERMIAKSELNQLPPIGLRYRTLTRMILDQWPLSTPLGASICELEDQYARL